MSFTDGDNDDFLKNIYVPFNCKFFIIKKFNDVNYEIKDVYQIHENSSKIFSNFAIWENGKFEIFQNYLFSKRMNLNGFELNLGSPCVRNILYSLIKINIGIIF